MASKRKRKKVDLYWPTVFILAIGVLVGALFLGKYIGDIFVTGGNLNSSEEESSYSPQIKTLAKPTIISQSKTLAQEKDNTQIILPPSFNTHPKGVYTPKAVSTPVAKVTPTVGVEKNKEIEVSVNVSAPTPVISSMANKNLDSVTDNNSGKTDSEIDKMINTTSNNNITTETAGFKLGDRVHIDTPAGKKELKVTGILRQVPFNSSELTLTAFVVTEKVFSDIMGEAGFKVIDIQLTNKKDEETVEILKSMAVDGISLFDMRQKNSEMNQLFLTMAVFVYGFVAVIAIISILNIMNTMNTSVITKTRYLGVMRAVGMSGRQLNRMVLAEAATYSFIGSAAGSILWLLLQKLLIMNYLSSFNIKWRFPLLQIIIILVLVSTVTVLSVIGPLKRIREKSITEIVNSL